jgi:hypothetical protein
MFAKRRTSSNKHRFAISSSQADLDDLANSVNYGGNGEHKRNPGDFGLNPPLGPRPNKTLCDGVKIFNRREALRLLREGIRRGLVSEQRRGKFPQNVWAVTDQGIPLEAQLENAMIGTYHGYPMQHDDAFGEKVIEKWNANTRE